MRAATGAVDAGGERGVGGEERRMGKMALVKRDGVRGGEGSEEGKEAAKPRTGSGRALLHGVCALNLSGAPEAVRSRLHGGYTYILRDSIPPDTVGSKQEAIVKKLDWNGSRRGQARAPPLLRWISSSNDAREGRTARLPFPHSFGSTWDQAPPSRGNPELWCRHRMTSSEERARGRDSRRGGRP